ncbi:MAG: hypothetical protein Ct9H90mP27_6810 [Gammaproteobacteria bacterium]|nr:MAG: hypothetical protein Ct9H90mP27_6810 [Gammaproteobacteria bacterium]
MHSQIVAPYLLHYGNEEQKQKWLPKMATGEMVGAIPMTEPNTGSDLQNVKTSATKKGDSYVINGAKTYITNGIPRDLVVLVAKTDPNLGAKGISLIIVEANTKGFNKGRNLKKLGLNSGEPRNFSLMISSSQGQIYLVRKRAKVSFSLCSSYPKKGSV